MRGGPTTVCYSLLLGYSSLQGWVPAVPTAASISTSEQVLRMTDASSLRNGELDPEFWLPTRATLEVRQQYLDLVREYEARERYGIATREEAGLLVSHQRAFARYLLLKMSSQKVSREIRKIDRRNGGAITRTYRVYQRAIRAARRPVTFSSGGNKARYGTSFNLLEQYGKAWLKSVAFDTEVTFQPEESWVPLPLRRKLDLFAPKDRWTLLISRPLPLGATEGRLSYGTTASKLRFTIVKTLRTGLQAEYRLSSLLASASKLEHTLLVQYALRI